MDRVHCLSWPVLVRPCRALQLAAASACATKLYRHTISTISGLHQLQCLDASNPSAAKACRWRNTNMCSCLLDYQKLIRGCRYWLNVPASLGSTWVS